MPKITALSSFRHGPYELRKGATLDVPAATAQQLSDAGLATIEKPRKAPVDSVPSADNTGASAAPPPRARATAKAK